MNIWNLVIPSLFSKILQTVRWKFSLFASALCFPSSTAGFLSTPLSLTFLMTLGQTVQKKKKKNRKKTLCRNLYSEKAYTEPLIATTNSGNILSHKDI